MTIHITKEISDAFAAYENGVIDHDITGSPITRKAMYQHMSIVDFAAGCQAGAQATPMSEADFIEWFGRNYPYDTVILEPDWHARSIYRRVTRTVNQAKEQSHTREQIGLHLDDRREGLGAHHVYCRAVTEDV